MLGRCFCHLTVSAQMVKKPFSGGKYIFDGALVGLPQ